MSFSCDKCQHEFKTKFEYNRHLSRKVPCGGKTLKDIVKEQVKEHVEEQVEELKLQVDELKETKIKMEKEIKKLKKTVKPEENGVEEIKDYDEKEVKGDVNEIKDDIKSLTETMANVKLTVDHSAVSNKEALKNKIHEIHNYLRNNGAGYGMNALKVFNVIYGLKKI